jgi:hypothetical protein
MTLDDARESAAATLSRMRATVASGHAFTLSPESARAVAAYVAALEKAMPSVGAASDLEVKCRACEGKGGDCDDCDGAGTVPTEAGRRVLDLVMRHMGGGE